MSDRQPVTVAALDPGREDDWDRFVRAHPEGSFFHLAGWKSVLEGAFGHRVHPLVARRGREVVGILPLVELRNRIFARALVSMAFGAYGGPLAEDRVAGQALDRAATALGERLGAAYVEYRLRAPFDPDRPRREDLHATFSRAITGDHDANLKAIPRKQRAVVRKALAAEDLSVEAPGSPATFYALYAESLRNLGTPVFARRYLDRLMAVFGDACEVLVIREKGRPVSGVLSFYYGDTVLPYYGGGSPAARASGANDLMYWALMCRAADHGYRVFDFGRSKVGSGAYAFKKNWGFKPAPLIYEYYLIKGRAIPETNPLNPKYRHAIAAWQRLPLWLANRIGPPLARELG